MLPISKEISDMKTHSTPKKSGFTLLETVIAIGVLAVLLTGFLAVFGPAAAGIRRAINVQEADRLTSTLERELVALREGQAGGTGFGKAYDWIKESHEAQNALFVYQYRGDPSRQRSDGSLEPVAKLDGTPGTDFIVQPMCRRASDKYFYQDLRGIEGGVFLVKCTQLTYTSGGAGMEAKTSNKGSITDPDGGAGGGTAETYTAAVIAFAAEFYSMPAKTPEFFQGNAFATRFESFKNPMFVRNLAIRR